CLSDNCLVTRDRRMFSHSRAVIFHLRDINISDLPGNKSLNHLSDQYWVLQSWEAPFYLEDQEQFKAIEGEINWTMTYRHDSDIFSPYATIEKQDQLIESTGI